MSEYIKSMGRHLTNEEIKKVIAKYKVGDKVAYLDVDNVIKSGTIKSVEWTDINDWNKKLNPLYMIDGCPFLRKQSDIVKLGVKSIPKYNVGDKVYYVNDDGAIKIGTIRRIDETDAYNWNDKIEPLYTVGSCIYLRSEKDILDKYIANVKYEVCCE